MYSISFPERENILTVFSFQKEEAEYNRYKDVMAGDLGEWGNSEEKSDSGKSEKKENFTNASDDPSRNALSGLGDIEGVQML